MNPHFEPNRLVRNTTNSDGSMTPQNSKFSAPIQRPHYTYEELITMAISSRAEQMLPASDIIDWISRNYPYYRRDRKRLQNQVRRGLSIQDCFVGLERPVNLPGRGKLWVVAPEGYKPGDPIGRPHVEFASRAMRCDLLSPNPQADLAEKGVVDYPMQAEINSNFETNHSVLSITNSDGLISSQSSTSLVPIKPNFSFKDLIMMAIKSSPQKKLPACDIIDWISRNFPYYRKDLKHWQTTVRSTLSKYKCFLGMSRRGSGPRKKLLWTVVPENYLPGDTTPEELNKLQAEAMAPDVMQLKNNSRFEPNHSVRTIKNSYGLMSSQSFTSLTPIQKLNYIYKELIMMAINDSPQKVLSTCDIIDWMSRNFPYYRRDVIYWQEKVQSELSANKCFLGINRQGGEPENGTLWTVVPETHELCDTFAQPPATEEQKKDLELSKLQAEAVDEGATMASEPIKEVYIYQQQQDEL